VVSAADVPVLDGVHHLKLPVTDLGRSIAWYRERLGYDVELEFTEDGALAGVAMRHPNGGPRLALRRDPARCSAAAGFDYFSIGVPDKQEIDALADRLTRLGDSHAGVHFASIGWILPGLHDPDGHEVRFYTTQHHTDARDEDPLRFDHVRETSPAREAAYREGTATG
jgi:catechol 2,3-dioxygenase-like lactoylglutathione lyase family enzyme